MRDGPFLGGVRGALRVEVPPSSSGGGSLGEGGVFSTVEVGNGHRFEAGVASSMICSFTKFMDGGISGFGDGREGFSSHS